MPIMESTKQYLAKTLEFSFYILFFFTPLILWPQTSEIFEFNKMFFVYVMTIIIATSQLTLWAINKKIEIKRTPLDIPILLFLLSQVLSTIFSIHPYTSLVGYYSRWHGSLLSTISYITLYYIYINNFNHKKTANIIYAILGSSILVSIYAILEKLGIDKHLWVQDVQNRVFSSLGQPNWLAAYLVALLPLPIYLSYSAKTTNLKFIYSFIALLNIASIIFTKSQSGIGALVIIIILISLHLSFKHKHLFYPLFATYTILLIALFIIKPAPLLSLNKINPFYSTTAQIAAEDLSTRGQGGSDSMAIRRVVWDGAIKLGTKYPFFGTGVETFAYSYYQTRPAAHNLLSEWDFLYNKAHNEYLNYFATTGFVGLTTYLLLIVCFIFYYFKIDLKLKIKNLISFALFFGWISILITNFFGFSVVIIGVYFFLFPAIIISQSDLKTFSLPTRLHPLIITLPVFFVASYLLLITYNYWHADIIYNMAKTQLAAGKLQQSLNLFQQAQTKNSKEPLYTITLAQTQAQAASIIHAQLDNPQASISAQSRTQAEGLQADFVSKSQSSIDTTTALNPHHTTIYKTAATAQIYLSLIDPSHNKKALELLFKLNEIAPTDAKIVYNIGLIHETMQNQGQAQLAYRKALELKPDYQAAKDRLDALK